MTPEEKELACVICFSSAGCKSHKPNKEFCELDLEAAWRVKEWLKSSGFMEKWAREHGWVKVEEEEIPEGYFECPWCHEVKPLSVRCGKGYCHSCSGNDY